MRKVNFRILLLILLSLNFSGRLHVFSQSDLSATLREKFEKYVEAVPWEDVYIQTDRYEYIAGEEVWFSAWVTDRRSSKPSPLSSILYIEVLNQQNVPVSQKRIEVRSGRAEGELLLPDTLASGRFTLRAYTAWMKNFMPANCFRKNINVYNTLISGNKIRVPSRLPLREPAPRLTSSSINFKLIEESEKGKTIEISKTAYSANHCYLALQSCGNLTFCKKVILGGDRTTVFLEETDLGKGINQATLFDEAANPVAELYFFNLAARKSEKLPGFSLVSGKREKVWLTLSSAEMGLSLSDSVSLSVAVVPKSDWFFNTSPADWIILGSEFGVMPEDIGIKTFTGTGSATLAAVAQKLKSEWINWESIVAGNTPVIDFKPEKGVHYISGRLLSRETRKPLPGNYLFLSTPGKKAVFQYSRTGLNGVFSYPVPLSGLSYDLIIQPENTDLSATIVMDSPFSGSFKTPPANVSFVEAEVPEYILRLGGNQQVSKIYGNTLALMPPNVTQTVVSKTRFYGKPDVELKLDDYIKLPVMQEIFFELLPGVPLRSRKSGYEIRMLDPVEQKNFLRPPVLFVDGVVINDAGIIAGLDPELVEQIDIVKDRYIIGDYLFYGIINVITRRGDFTAVTLPEYAVRFRFRTSDPTAAFVIPDYSNNNTASARVPDFRNTVYWNGDLKPSNDEVSVQFYTSDLPGDYEITVSGITSSGEPVSVSRKLTVK